MWTSYRKFIVDRIVSESASAKSFYLIPADGGALAPYHPGQHLPLRLTIAGQSLPVHRFYTLSDCDNGRHYRLTIKRERPPAHLPGAPAGLSSGYFNDQLKPGDVIEAKVPSGGFFLDLSKNHPVALIAGGIGVTPLLAMANAVARHQPDRPVWFYFALRGNDDHVFKDHLLAHFGHCPNLRLTVLYENPRPQDRLGVDYHRQGRVDMGLLSQPLATKNTEYFICGPSPMMTAIVGALKDAGVSAEKIRTESFGPSSLAYQSAPRDEEPTGSSVQSAPSTNAVIQVTFAKTAKTATWDPKMPSLWDFAQANGVDIDSGCLYGDCGTCMTRLIQGKVKYNHDTSMRPDPGTCLVCSCRPDGSIVIDA
jgi:uncharacterized protein